MPGVGGISQGGAIAIDEVTVTWGIGTDFKLSQDCCALAGTDVSKKAASKNTNRHKNIGRFIGMSPKSLPSLYPFFNIKPMILLQGQNDEGEQAKHNAEHEPKSYPFKYFTTFSPATRPELMANAEAIPEVSLML